MVEGLVVIDLVGWLVGCLLAIIALILHDLELLVLC